MNARDKIVAALVGAKYPMSRSRIARATGLPDSLVGALLTNLIEEGRVAVQRQSGATTNRRVYRLADPATSKATHRPDRPVPASVRAREIRSRRWDDKRGTIEDPIPLLGEPDWRCDNGYSLRRSATVEPVRITIPD